MSGKHRGALLAAVAVCCLIALPAAGTSDVSDAGTSVDWNIDDGTLTVNGSGTTCDDPADIPWEGYGDVVTAIVVGEGITDIGSNSFYGFGNVTSVTLPKSLRTIGNFAFYGCGSLTAIDIPEGVTRIGNQAFMYCDSVQSVTIPDTVTFIDMMSFGCKDLKDLTMPVDVCKRGQFSCTGLTSVTLTKGTTGTCVPDEWGYEYTPWCSSHGTLTSVTIGEGVVLSDERLFAECDHVTTLTLDTADGSFVFRGGSVGEIFPGGLTSVGISRVPTSDLPAYVREAVGDRPVFDISAGTAGDAGEPVTITLKYDLGEGEDPENLIIWHITDSGIEEVPCTYSGGSISFETDRFSYYAVMYDAPSEGGDNTLVIVAVAAVILILAIGLFLFMRSRDILPLSREGSEKDGAGSEVEETGGSAEEGPVDEEPVDEEPVEEAAPAEEAVKEESAETAEVSEEEVPAKEEPTGSEEPAETEPTAGDGEKTDDGPSDEDGPSEKKESSE